LNNNIEAGDSSAEGGGMHTRLIISRENIIYDV
jgi:hypothetical protein